MTGRWHHFVAGGLVSLAVVLATAALSAWPAWRTLPPDTALLRLSFTQSGARTCRDRTAEELAALPRNMRQAQVCERRRAPVYVEMALNGEIAFAENLPPGGLSGSGPSRVYERFELPAGSYAIDLRLRTDPSVAGFTDTATRSVRLDPGQSLAIDYYHEAGGFVFQ